MSSGNPNDGGMIQKVLDLPIEDVLKLPRWARVALAARCARRVQPLLYETPGITREQFVAIDKTIAAAEEVAAGKYSTNPTLGDVGFCIDLANDSYNVTRNSDSVTSLISSAAGYAAAAAHDSCADGVFWHESDHCLIASMRIASQAAQEMGRSVDDAIRQDYRLLADAADRDLWHFSTAVAQSFFSLYSRFDCDDNATGILVIAEGKLLDHFYHHPDELYSITPRKFEQFVAELFDTFGYDVQLTRSTRDGGRDIIAIDKRVSPIRILIECKRNAKERKVGVNVVRSLHGIVNLEGANKGIIATTSSFTRDAQATLERQRWLLEGRDFDGLLKWLDTYQRFKLHTDLGLWLPKRDLGLWLPKKDLGEKP